MEGDFISGSIFIELFNVYFYLVAGGVVGVGCSPGYNYSCLFVCLFFKWCLILVVLLFIPLIIFDDLGFGSERFVFLFDLALFVFMCLVFLLLLLSLL